VMRFLRAHPSGVPPTWNIVLSVGAGCARVTSRPPGEGRDAPVSGVGSLVRDCDHRSFVEPGDPTIPATRTRHPDRNPNHFMRWCERENGNDQREESSLADDDRARRGGRVARGEPQPRPARRCAGGRYVVKGRALIASDTPDGEDAVVLSIPGVAEGAAPAIAIASGCPEAPVTLETRKHGTRVKAVLTGCAGGD